MNEGEQERQLVIGRTCGRSNRSTEPRSMRAAERAEPMRRQGGKRNRYRDQRTAAEKEAVLIKRTHQQKSPTVCDAPDSHKTSR